MKREIKEEKRLVVTLTKFDVKRLLENEHNQVQKQFIQYLNNFNNQFGK